jgi:hypothetical protein
MLASHGSTFISTANATKRRGTKGRGAANLHIMIAMAYLNILWTISHNNDDAICGAGEFRLSVVEIHIVFRINLDDDASLLS